MSIALSISLGCSIVMGMDKSQKVKLWRQQAVFQGGENCLSSSFPRFLFKGVKLNSRETQDIETLGNYNGQNRGNFLSTFSTIAFWSGIIAYLWRETKCSALGFGADILSKKRNCCNWDFSGKSKEFFCVFWSKVIKNLTDRWPRNIMAIVVCPLHCWRLSFNKDETRRRWTENKAFLCGGNSRPRQKEGALFMAYRA